MKQEENRKEQALFSAPILLPSSNTYWLSPAGSQMAREKCTLQSLSLVPQNRVERVGLELKGQFSHSVMSDSVTPWTAVCQASLSINNSQSMLKIIPLSR